MNTRNLAGLEVSELGLGCMGMSEYYGSANEADAIATIRRALDLGITLLDTADTYGPFTNERLVGRAIEGRREQVVLATKFGNVRGADGARLGIRGDHAYVHQACDASLERLGVDHIDLYYVRYLEQNVEAVDVELTADDLETLEHAFPAGIAAGARYVPAGMRTVGA